MTSTATPRILVTGGSGGMGSSIAIACAKRGAWPIVGYYSREDRACRTIELCGAGEILRLDLSREDCGIDGRCPAVDAVVHCAGAITRQRKLLDSSDAEVLHLFTMNALGPLRLTCRLVRECKEMGTGFEPGGACSGRTGRGEAPVPISSSLKHVVFILSTAIACRGSGPYAVSKTAALAVAKLLSSELEPCGVRVDALVPGWTSTEMARFAAESMGRQLDDVRRQHPGGKILEPSQIGELCAALLLGKDRPPEPQLVLWDTRLAPTPFWQSFNTVLAFDRAPQT